jgi:hypothetical protein
MADPLPGAPKDGGPQRIKYDYDRWGDGGSALIQLNPSAFAGKLFGDRIRSDEPLPQSFDALDDRLTHRKIVNHVEQPFEASDPIQELRRQIPIPRWRGCALKPEPSVNRSLRGSETVGARVNGVAK